MFLAILPEIGLVVLAVLVMALDLVLGETRRRNLGWVTAGGLLVIAALSILFSRPGSQPALVLGGMLRFDWMTFTFRLVFLFGAAVTALFGMDTDRLGERGEFYLLLLASTLGMSLMAGAADLIMLYLAIETTSIPLYILAGFLTRDEKSTEASFKYMLFGAMTSAVMLYGFSLIYGFAGTTQIYSLGQALAAGGLSPFALVGVVLLILVGFGFKISAVPLHFWAPDVYEGAPSPVAGFLSTASKAAGFAVLMRILQVAFPMVGAWTLILAIISTASMIVGNFLALTQKNIKRLLAYSSIAQAGYILVGVASISSLSSLGNASAVYYLIAYLVTNLAAFGVVAIVGQAVGSSDLAAFNGLSRRAPALALALLVAFLSLAGIPPFGGFVGKVLVFAAAINANLVWLAVIGILNSIVGLYYYLTVVKVAYLNRSEDEAKPMPVSWPWKVALVVCVAGIILLGVLVGPWFSWVSGAVTTLF